MIYFELGTSPPVYDSRGSIVYVIMTTIQGQMFACMHPQASSFLKHRKNKG